MKNTVQRYDFFLKQQEKSSKITKNVSKITFRTKIEKIVIPEPFVNTYFLIKAFKQVIEISDVLGKDATELKARLENPNKELRLEEVEEISQKK